MIRKNRGEISWLEFNLLQGTGVQHAVFLKQGMQLENLGVEEALVLHQVHGKEIVLADREKEIGRKKVFGDGLITKEKGIALSVEHADCQPAIFYDPVQHVVGVVHAGWRGMVHNIYKEAVERLESAFHVKRENLLVCIGPSLEPEHSEFIHYKQEFPETFWRFQFKPNYFNLWEIARFQLRELGILPHQIEMAEMGTYGNPDDFYSYRRTKSKTDRHTTVCVLK